MSATRAQEVLVCFGKGKQTDIATAQVAAAMWRMNKLNAALADPKLGVEDDAAEYGKGTEFATDNQLTNWDLKGSLKAEMDDWIAGWALAFVMGKDVVTAGSSSSSSLFPPFTHAIAFDESTTQAKMTNIYMEDTNDVKTKYPDFAVSDVTINWTAKGSVGFEVGLISTGRWLDEAMASLPALPDNAYLLNSDTVFRLAPFDGDLADYTGRFISQTLKISSGVVSHVTPGGGKYGIFMRTGLRKFSWQARIAAKDTDDIRTLMNNDTMAKMDSTTTSGLLPSILAVSIPKFKLKTNKIGVDGNMVIWDVEADETTALKVVGGAPVDALSATVQNSVPAYLTGVAGESSSSSSSSSSSTSSSSSSSSSH